MQSLNVCNQLVGPANRQKTKKNKKINEPKADLKSDKQASSGQANIKKHSSF